MHDHHIGDSLGTWQIALYMEVRRSAGIFFFLQKRVLNLAHEYSRRLRGYMHNFVEDLHVLEFFKVAQ